MSENSLSHNSTPCQAGLFSFKNYQLKSVTDSLFRPSGRVCETRPIGGLYRNVKNIAEKPKTK